MKGSDMPRPLAVPPAELVPEDRAVRRYVQIRSYERTIARLDDEIAGVKAHLDVLKKDRERILGFLLAAARDEGELPLFAEL